MNCESHRLANFDSSRPESLRSGLSELRRSDARRVRRLMISCSVDGMKPADRAFYILHEKNGWERGGKEFHNHLISMHFLV